MYPFNHVFGGRSSGPQRVPFGPVCRTPPRLPAITTTLLLPLPAHPSPPLLVVLSGAVNEKDWTDTIGRRRAR